MKMRARAYRLCRGLRAKPHAKQKCLFQEKRYLPQTPREHV